MTNRELSDRFDVLVNAYNIQQGPGIQDYLAFDEYEKSVFLTQALADFVVSFYDGKNPHGNIFEKTEEDRRFLNSLVKTKTITQQTVPYPTQEGISTGTNNSYFYTLPSDLLFITYEQVRMSVKEQYVKSRTALVVPITQDDFYKTAQNPFRGPSQKRVLRLDFHDNIIELVSKNPIVSYQVRYVRKPNPIILIDLPDGLEIWGKHEETPCELSDATHEWILNRAVQLALSSKNVGANK